MSVGPPRNNVEIHGGQPKDKVKPVEGRPAESRKFSLAGALSSLLAAQGPALPTSSIRRAGFTATRRPRTPLGRLRPRWTKFCSTTSDRHEVFRLKLRVISMACCLNMCGAVHCSDIAILGYHRKPPLLDHEYLDKMCRDSPWPLAACPTAAIKPDQGGNRWPEGEFSVEGQAKSVACSAATATPCAPPCPWLTPRATASSSWPAARCPTASAIPSSPRLSWPSCPTNNPAGNPPLSCIKNMVEAYAAGANKYERFGEWAERIGWERFFDVTGLEFTHHLIDDFRDPAYYTWRQSSQFKF